MSDEQHDAEGVAFYVYGLDPADVEHAFNIGEGDSSPQFDHEAHEAATICMEALKERFDWAEDITGMSMGVE